MDNSVNTKMTMRQIGPNPAGHSLGQNSMFNASNAFKAYAETSGGVVGLGKREYRVCVMRVRAFKRQCDVSSDICSEGAGGSDGGGSDSGDACLWQFENASVADCSLNLVIRVGAGLHRDQDDDDHTKHQYHVVQHMATKLVTVGQVHDDVMFIPTLAEE